MRRLLMLVLTTALLANAAGLSLAQDKNDKPAAPPEDGEKLEETQTRLKPVKLQELVVTPGKAEEPASEVTESITIITAEHLEQSAAVDATEALRAVPGLFLRQNGGIGGSSVPYLRGTLGTQTVVLIDGIQVNDPTLGYQFDFDDLDTSNIERIEVIRGAEAAMYGPGAVGGVINVITRRGRGKPRNIVRSMGGSYGTGHVQLGSAGEKAGFSHSFAISQLTTDNAQRSNQSDKTTLSGRFRLNLDENRTVDIVSRFVTSRHEEPYEFVTFPAHIEEDPNIVRRQDQLALGTKYEHRLSSIISMDAFVSMYDSVSKFLNDDDDGSGTPEFRFTSEATTVTGRLQGIMNMDEVLGTPDAKSRFLVGGEWTWEDTLTASSFGLTPDRIQNRAGYMQSRFKLLGRVIFTSSYRVDGHSTYGTNESPGAGIRIDAWQGGALRSNWSRAFRPPSNAELTDPWVGNPDLKKERRDGFDAGILQQLFDGGVKAELTYFQTRIDDNIGYDANTFRMENFDTHAEGIEVHARLFPAAKFSIDLSYTHLAARNMKDKTSLAGRSPNFGGVRISRSFGAFTITVSGYFSEKVPPEGILDEKGLQQKNVGKVDLVNLAVLYKLARSSKLILKVTNCLDKRYRENERAPKAPGVGLFLGISTEL